jgi:hypothetical protein
LRRNIRKATIWTAHTVTVNSLIESNKQTNKQTNKDLRLSRGEEGAVEIEEVERRQREDLPRVQQNRAYSRHFLASRFASLMNVRMRGYMDEAK